MIIALKLVAALALIVLGISTFYYQFWEINRVHTYMMLFAVNVVGLGVSVAYDVLPKIG